MILIKKGCRLGLALIKVLAVIAIYSVVVMLVMWVESSSLVTLSALGIGGLITGALGVGSMLAEWWWDERKKDSEVSFSKDFAN
jgi:hypothetical protein